MSAGEDEIELKFLCEPSDAAAVLAAAPAGEDKTKDLASTYYDTPDGALKKAGVSLRLRESGGAWVQTLKRGDGFAREEHEVPVADGRLDFAMPALAECLKPERFADLAPAFTVQVTRQQRTFAYGDAEIEMAVDQGEILGGGRRRAICEVELELIAGDCKRLFDVARQLARTAPLYLSFEGKSAQGRALVAGAERRPRKYAGVRLNANMTAARAFQAIVREALAQIAANAQLLRMSDDAEAVHQLRVAVRRLRSALTTFRKVAADAEFDRLKAELKWLAKACDEARDLDVFANDNAALAERRAAVGMADLAPVVGAAREQAYAKAAAAVASGRFRDLVLDLTAWTETGAWLTAPALETRREEAAPAFAAKALQKRWKALRHDGRHLEELDDATRHQVRIEAKKLRYAAEAFAALYDHKAADRFVARLKKLQGALGDLNDLAVAGRLVERLQPKGSGIDAARALIEAREAGRPEAVEAAVKAMKRLRKTEPFWKA